MRYCGSKRRFMKYLLPILTKDMDENTVFIDLFGGGMNVVCEIPCDYKVAVDYNKYVIALWKELQENGMKNIPTDVTEEMYNDVKNCYLNKTYKYKDFIIGYVGTCCSFGGSWFNGYARFNPNKNEDHIKEKGKYPFPFSTLCIRRSEFRFRRHRRCARCRKCFRAVQYGKFDAKRIGISLV